MTSHPRRLLTRVAEPLTFDISVNFDFNSSNSAQLTMEFIKFLCLQKGQIPVSCSQLKNLSEMARLNLGSSSKEQMTSKEKSAAFKTRRKQMQFVKKADNFQRSLGNVLQSVVSCFEAKNDQVAVILGTSLFNPKEIFILDWSHWPLKQCGPTACSDKNNFQKDLANFFRFLVTTEKLYPILQAVRPTNLHVLCQTDSLTPIGCIPRLNYKHSCRAPQVTLRILPKNPIPFILSSDGSHDGDIEPYELTSFSPGVNAHTYRAVSRRLIFSSPAPIPKNFQLKDCSLLDISGIGQLEDDVDKESNKETLNGTVSHTCWFQIQSSLSGFLETYVTNI
ncbi:uncharacterized protein LOC130701141 [Daphnia carinata]|uniref:uncharacterized protein LOC130701141 n=1 Tax=Daphnia carinata TaxID=120202 RepID=UPI00257DE602|nr:uncharacterized protein LOC130701141 [Daphnia carinata]